MLFCSTMSRARARCSRAWRVCSSVPTACCQQQAAARRQSSAALVHVFWDLDNKPCDELRPAELVSRIRAAVAHFGTVRRATRGAAAPPGGDFWVRGARCCCAA